MKHWTVFRCTCNDCGTCNVIETPTEDGRYFCYDCIIKRMKARHPARLSVVRDGPQVETGPGD